MHILLCDSHEIMWRHQRSQFFIIASHRKAAEACMVSLRSVYHAASHYVHVDIEATLRSRDLISTVHLDLMISSYVYFDAYQWEDLDGVVISALSCLVQKLLAKKYLFSSAAIFYFFTPVTSFFTWFENDLCKNCRSRPLISNTVYHLS